MSLLRHCHEIVGALARQIGVLLQRGVEVVGVGRRIAAAFAENEFNESRHSAKKIEEQQDCGRLLLIF